MSATVNLDEVRAILGDDLLGPREVERAFGTAVPRAGERIPFARDELIAARRQGEMLILRLASVGEQTPVTILHMLERFPEAFDKKLLRQVGYQLKDEWGIALEPLAASDICTPGWALVRKEILGDSCNLTYDEQGEALGRYAATLKVPATALRRRSAVEAVYDTLLYFVTRNTRLLEKTWDWSGSRTVDGGYLNVGGFTSTGMQILSFSRAVRHGGLGVCPTRQRID
jgi:hypothetical protein